MDLHDLIEQTMHVGIYHSNGKCVLSTTTTEYTADGGWDEMNADNYK